MRLDPQDSFAYQNVSDGYLTLGRLDEAQAVIDQAAARKIDPRATRFTRYFLAFMRGDEAAMLKVVDETPARWTSRSCFYTALAARWRWAKCRKRVPRLTAAYTPPNSTA